MEFGARVNFILAIGQCSTKKLSINYGQSWLHNIKGFTT